MIIKRTARDAALRSLGIDTKDVLRVEFLPDAIKVYRLRRDDKGKPFVANDGPAQFITTYSVAR